jgi:hypothetical protein
LSGTGAELAEEIAFSEAVGAAEAAKTAVLEAHQYSRVKNKETFQRLRRELASNFVAISSRVLSSTQGTALRAGSKKQTWINGC